MTTQHPQAGHMLSARQLEIVTLASQGHRNIQIARKLGVSTDTVKTHLFRAYRQAGANDRTHLVAICLSADLIPRVKAVHPGAVA